MSKISIDSLVSELETARELALHSGHYNSAISATLGKAKLLGLHKGSADQENTKPVKVTE